MAKYSVEMRTPAERTSFARFAMESVLDIQNAKEKVLNYTKHYESNIAGAFSQQGQEKKDVPSESGPSALAPQGPGSCEPALHLLRRHPLISNQTINFRRDGGAGRTALTFRRDPHRVQKKLFSLLAGWWCPWVTIPTRDSWEHVGAQGGTLCGGSCSPRIPVSHRF